MADGAVQYRTKTHKAGRVTVTVYIPILDEEGERRRTERIRNALIRYGERVGQELLEEVPEPYRDKRKEKRHDDTAD